MIMNSKNYLVRSLILGLVLMIGFSSCSKDDGADDSSTPATKTDILTAHLWKLKSAKVSPGVTDPILGITIDDFTAFMEACDRDDTFEFNADGTVIADEGATKCDSSDPQSESGNWSFQNDETSILIIVGTDSQALNIDELETGNFVGSQTIDDLLGDGVSRTITFTYEKN